MKLKLKSIKAKGFTLIEVMVVVAVLGTLVAFLAPSLMGQTDKPKANNMIKVADAARTALTQYNAYCGTPVTVTGNAIILAGKTIEDVIFGGSPNIATAYLSPNNTCVDKSGVRALDRLGKKTATGYSVENYAATFTDITGGYTGTVYQKVPDTILTELLATVVSNPTINPAGDSTGTRIRYSAPTSGLYTVTVLAN